MGTTSINLGPLFQVGDFKIFFPAPHSSCTQMGWIPFCGSLEFGLLGISNSYQRSGFDFWNSKSSRTLCNEMANSISEFGMTGESGVLSNEKFERNN